MRHGSTRFDHLLHDWAVNKFARRQTRMMRAVATLPWLWDASHFTHGSHWLAWPCQSADGVWCKGRYRNSSEHVWCAPKTSSPWGRIRQKAVKWSSYSHLCSLDTGRAWPDRACGFHHAGDPGHVPCQANFASRGEHGRNAQCSHAVQERSHLVDVGPGVGRDKYCLDSIRKRTQQNLKSSLALSVSRNLFKWSPASR